MAYQTLLLLLYSLRRTPADHPEIGERQQKYYDGIGLPRVKKRWGREKKKRNKCIHHPLFKKRIWLVCIQRINENEGGSRERRKQKNNIWRDECREKGGDGKTSKEISVTLNELQKWWWCKKMGLLFFLFFTFYMGRSSAFNKQKSSQN